MGFSIRGICIFIALASLVTLSITISPNVIAQQRHVSRDISSTSINPGDSVNVTLRVALASGDLFYLIDEIVPSGWTVINNGSLYETEAGHLKIAVISGAASTSYTYSIASPPVDAYYSVSGTYFIEGMPGFHATQGESSITVGNPITYSGNGESSTTGSSNGFSFDGIGECEDGIISSLCICQGSSKSQGYCCGGIYQTIPCGNAKTNDQIQEKCNDGDVSQCGTDTGICEYGTRTCTNGIWGECSGGIQPSPEYYDGMDNDCDGGIDEDCSVEDIFRCASDPSMCLCKGQAQGESPFAGNASYLPATEHLLMLLCAIIITLILFFSKNRLAGATRMDVQLSGTSPESPPLHRKKTFNREEAILMSMKGIIKD